MSAEKTTILFLHGALGTAEDLFPLMSHFEKNGYRTLSMNFSGHSKSTRAALEFRIENFAQDLDEYIKKHDLRDPIVFGYSMGGYVALYHAAHFEDSPIRQIITYGTKFDWSEETVKKELPKLDPEFLQTKSPEFVRSLAQKHGPDRWKTLLLSTAHMMQNIERLDGLTSADVEDIRAEVLLLRGGEDRMVNFDETKTMAAQIPNAKCKEIPGSRHEIEKADLESIAKAMEEFI